MNIHLNKYGSGKALVFFHGWGFDSQIWTPLIPQLEQKYQLIMVDLPGFGQSSMMDWSCFKNQLLPQLPEHFILIGWSMGGLYATRMAIEAPERVLQLINITSSPRFLVDKDWPGVSKEVFNTFYQNLINDSRSTLIEFLKLQSINDEAINLDQLPSVSGLKSGLETLVTWDLRGHLEHLTQPVCYLFGRLDPIVPVSLMNSMQKLYSKFNYIYFKRAAHVPFLSHKNLFIKEIEGFIT